MIFILSTYTLHLFFFSELDQDFVVFLVGNAITQKQTGFDYFSNWLLNLNFILRFKYVKIYLFIVKKFSIVIPANSTKPSNFL